ncbi:MAG: branched-chain amino acid ABC transporter permease, partial [Pseudomonadota bacterium]|nr:branched-chain amino acid ABC transporter permease [Pseudomonadota bacterium]
MKDAMKRDYVIMLVLLAALIVAPMFVYPVFLMKLLCFALFA